MKIIISPAKKMRRDEEIFPARSMPVYLNQANMLLRFIRKLTFAEKRALWNCNEKLALENEERFAEMDLEQNLTSAILSYEGIQYQYMSPEILENDAMDYLQNNLRILSGFYGILRPLDGIVPYRLEMQSKPSWGQGSKPLLFPGKKENLYAFWGKRLYNALGDEDRIILNLASNEYSKCISSYLTKKDRMITCIFGSLENEKVVQKGVYAKMARGEMVRWMAERQVSDAEQLKEFDVEGYAFDAERSDDRTFVFLK